MQHTFLKIDQSQTNPRFSIKKLEPQKKKDKFRSSEKSPAVATLIVTVCATKKCVGVTLCVFAHGLSLIKCASMRCVGVD